MGDFLSAVLYIADLPPNELEEYSLGDANLLVWYGIAGEGGGIIIMTGTVVEPMTVGFGAGARQRRPVRRASVYVVS